MRALRFACCVLILALCGGPSLPATAEREITLTLGIYTGGRWDVPIANSDSFFDNLIEKFEADHPNVRVVYKSGIRKQDYSNWLADCVLSDAMPDVFLVLPTDLNYLSRIGVLEELEGYMRNDLAYDPDNFFRSALGEGMVGGGRYAIAYEIAPTLMLVNKTLLAASDIPFPEKDWTLEDFYEICKRVTRDSDGDGKIDQFGVYDFSWQEVVHTNSIQLFSEDGREGYFNQAAMTDVVTYMKTLDALNTYQKPTSNDFDGGRVAFRPFLFSSYKAYKPYPYRLKKYSNFEWDCLPLPRGKSGANGSSALQSALIGMSASSQRKDLAWELMKMLVCDEEMQRGIIDSSYGIPVLRTIFSAPGDVPLLPSDEMLNLETLLEIVEHSISEPSFGKYGAAMRIADREISALISSQVDITQALVELNGEINSILSS